MNLEDDGPALTPPATSEPRAQGEDNGEAFVIPEWAIPRIDDLIIEDGQRVDSVYFDKLMRLLTESLYSSWSGPGEGRTFAVFANVGLFPEDKQTPLAPDVMLSLDVPVGRDLARKENNSYFVWVMGKPPDVVIEFVSDRRGGEATHKMKRYAAIGVAYYVIYDPQNRLGGGVLRGYELHARHYEPIDPRWLPEIGLGLQLWQGKYENATQGWLRWCDQQGNAIPTGRERAELADQRASDAQKRAGDAEQQAERERKRAERLAERLRALGVEPPPDEV